jgi:hypothetical protein
MNGLSKALWLLLVAVLNGAHGIAQSSQAESSALIRRVDALPKEVSLADGRLQLINLYKLEASILLGSPIRTRAEMVDQLVRDVFTPYASFGEGILAMKLRSENGRKPNCSRLSL